MEVRFGVSLGFFGAFMRFHHHTESFWRASGPMLGFPMLSENVLVDVAIVGAGITGLTAAYALQSAGVKVAILEARSIGAGASGRNSGHLTSMLDERYFRLLSHLGEKKARTLSVAIRDSIDRVQKTSEVLGIDCDITERDGYLYADEPAHADLLKKECEAAALLGVPVEFVDSCPLPFETFGAVRFRRQFSLQPMRYLEGLAREIIRLGGKIFERAHVDAVEDGSPCQVRVGAHKVTARHVILATHTPIGFNAVQAELKPYTSYVLAARLAQQIPSALYWDLHEPYFYTNALPDNRLVVGGMDHATGEDPDTDERFEQLENYVRRRYAVEEIEYRWSEEFYYPVDGVPLIGRSPFSENVFIATGYAGEGLSYGTLAGHLLCSEIMGESKEISVTLSPTRFGALSSPKRFISVNLRNAGHILFDRLRTSHRANVCDLEIGEGCIVSNRGQKVALYRRDEQVFIALSPRCKHMGCFVAWNESEKTWDCPCHGGRYSAEGDVLEGPPLKGLDRVSLPIDFFAPPEAIPIDEKSMRFIKLEPTY